MKLLCVVLQDSLIPELCEPTNDAFAFSAEVAEWLQVAVAFPLGIELKIVQGPNSNELMENNCKC